MLDNGVGISLINHVPEELLFASLTGVQVCMLCSLVYHPITLCVLCFQVDFVYSSSSQQFNANIQHIQVMLFTAIRNPINSVWLIGNLQNVCKRCLASSSSHVAADKEFWLLL